MAATGENNQLPAQGFIKLLYNEQFADCTLEVTTCVKPEQSMLIKAHKLILAMASPVFAKRLYHNSAADTHQLEIKVLTLSSFKTLLECVYSQQTYVITSFKTAWNVYNAAKHYEMREVQQRVVEKMISFISIENVSFIHNGAQIINEERLMYECMEFIKANTLEVLASDNFKKSSPETLLYILEQDVLQIDSELDLFRAVERKSLVYRNAKFIQKAVRRIRFLTLTPTEFASVPARSSLLTKDDAFSILMALVDGSPLPDGFDRSKEKRQTK